MKETLKRLQQHQKTFPLGFTAYELEKMCYIVSLFLSTELLTVTLPKCQKSLKMKQQLEIPMDTLP